MLSNYEIVQKFKEGASILSITNGIVMQEKVNNAARKKEDKIKLNSRDARWIVEQAIYQDIIKSSIAK